MKTGKKEELQRVLFWAQLQADGIKGAAQTIDTEEAKAAYLLYFDLLLNVGNACTDIEESEQTAEILAKYASGIAAGAEKILTGNTENAAEFGVLCDIFKETAAKIARATAPQT